MSSFHKHSIAAHLKHSQKTQQIEHNKTYSCVAIYRVFVHIKHLQ